MYRRQRTCDILKAHKVANGNEHMQVCARVGNEKRYCTAVALQTMLISIINKLLGNWLRDLHCLPYKTRGQSVPPRRRRMRMHRSVAATGGVQRRIDRVCVCVRACKC